PAALICSMAVSTPCLTISPYCVTAPVKGPAMAVRMVSAWAAPDKSSPVARLMAAATGRKRTFIENTSVIVQESIHRERRRMPSCIRQIRVFYRVFENHCTLKPESLQQAAQHPGVLLVHVQTLGQ